MTDTFRALCAELANAYEHELNKREMGCDLINRARALLAQPVAEGPTDEELLDLADWEVWDHQLLAFARAAIARFGRPTPQPVAYTERLQAVEALAADAVSGLRYIEQTHGRLYGVGWDRVFDAAAKFLPANALPTPEATNE